MAVASNTSADLDHTDLDHPDLDLRLDPDHTGPPSLPPIFSVSEALAHGLTADGHQSSAYDLATLVEGGEAPKEPLMFLIPNTAVVGPNDPVVMPSISERVDFEGELAVVIGRMCKKVSVEEAMKVVFGYTIANDVTARDLQKSDGQWSRAKGFDTFCPLGPWIETELDPSATRVTTRVDGEVKQDGPTSDMIHDVAQLISHASQAFTLLPGDVILTGTPEGVGQVRAGQRVEVEIPEIGVLANTYVADEDDA